MKNIDCPERNSLLDLLFREEIGYYLVTCNRLQLLRFGNKVYVTIRMANEPRGTEWGSTVCFD